MSYRFEGTINETRWDAGRRTFGRHGVRSTGMTKDRATAKSTCWTPRLALLTALAILAASPTHADTVTEPIWTTNTGHSDRVSSVTFSADSTQFLTASWDHTAKLWDIGTRSDIRNFATIPRALNAAVFSPDETQILVGITAHVGTHPAFLLDATTGAVVGDFFGHAHSVTSVAFSPDGTQILTGSSDDTAKLWDATPETEFNQTEITVFSGHTGGIESVAFSADGTQVLTASRDNTAKLWDTGTGAEIRTFTGHSDFVWSAAFSPDGAQILTGSNDDTAKLWDTDTGILIRTFTGHTGGVTSVAFSPYGLYVLTGAGDQTAKLWNAGTGDEIRTFSGHTDTIWSVAYSPDGVYVLTGSEDNTAKLWLSGATPTLPVRGWALCVAALMIAVLVPTLLRRTVGTI